MIQSVTILGATGSIGLNSLQVIFANKDLFDIYALTANSNIDLLMNLCLKYHPKFVVLTSDINYLRLKDFIKYNKLRTKILIGEYGLISVVSAKEVDIVISAIVGYAGLKATIAAAKHGKKILLANKETLVIAGELFRRLAFDNGATILPIDSEHNAIFQILNEKLPISLSKKKIIESLIITASGGPFLKFDYDKFDSITSQMALNHPNWNMGNKISIDSATMMNKAFEVIEAYWLFDICIENIEVIIHPQSIIHSMVRFCDGSVLAHLGVPDIRLSIAYCLLYPQRIESGVKKLDFLSYNVLTFEKVDVLKFPCLDFAYRILNLKGDSGCIVNAANEVAIDAFLSGEIKFNQIFNLIDYCLNNIEISYNFSLEDIIEKDLEVRKLANKLIVTNFN